MGIGNRVMGMLDNTWKKIKGFTDDAISTTDAATKNLPGGNIPLDNKGREALPGNRRERQRTIGERIAPPIGKVIDALDPEERERKRLLGR